MTYYAHSGDKSDFSDWQLLHHHLEQVAKLARQLAQEACPNDNALAESAFAAGLLHDLGKYRPEFQLMIRKIPVQKERTYHKQAGAAMAHAGRQPPIVFAIVGHHGGIPDFSDVQDHVSGPSGKEVANALWDTAQDDCPDLKKLQLPELKITDKLHGDLFTRLVFSCLVDADWSDTGEHERIRKGWPEDPKPAKLDANGWLERALAFIERRAASCQDQRLKQIRGEILDACLKAAPHEPDLFSLTVPTGGGKTLSGLAFALRHAATHGQRRIIYVAPYLSILDQNAGVIREALGFGTDAPEVFEHHSLSELPTGKEYGEPQKEAAARRAENWDAPIIITTSVQFYESLFSNQPGRCRKLHNIAGSVIILDECQTLPPDLVAPTCAMLKQLRTLGCSIVLCTATQPAFDHEELKDNERLHAQEIIPAELQLFPKLKRVQVSWPNRDQEMTWAQVARRMKQETAALCIVNSKRAARELYAELNETGGHIVHLSTSMCPAHRLEALERVKKRLSRKKPVHLVSTQLVEAGVDIDFPFLMREMGPLEAIIQAAGRCNREGLIPEAGGRVIVFRSAEARAEPGKYYPPDRWYKAGRDKVEADFLGAGREPRIDVPGDVQDYYKRLYRSGVLDKQNIQGKRAGCQFQEVASAYALITDEGIAVLVTRWEGHESEIEELLNQVRRRPSRVSYRKLGHYQVNLRRNLLASVGTMISEEPPGVLVYRGAYDSALGLTGENADVLLLV
jgi:CRISPR-associated endonuclease/helicase Cas3